MQVVNILYSLRSIPARAMTGFLAHFANNLSHFSHGAEFFTDNGAEDDEFYGDEFFIFRDDESYGDLQKAACVVCPKQRNILNLIETIAYLFHWSYMLMDIYVLPGSLYICS